MSPHAESIDITSLVRLVIDALIRFTVNGVIANFAVQEVVAIAAFDIIVAAAANYAITIKLLYPVVPSRPDNHIRPKSTVQCIVTIRTDNCDDFSLTGRLSC